jgi:predicted Fe-Mo cluster-binding NifX family protein
MKIAVSALRPDAASEVNPRFGRAEYFVIADSESGGFTVKENPFTGGASGVGVRTAQMLADMGVAAVLTGSCGPNAYQILTAAGVDVVIGVNGEVSRAVEAYRAGHLKPTSGPDVGPHHGSQVSGPGAGRGMGRGMGLGMGQGMGRGIDAPSPGKNPAPPPRNKLEELKEEAATLSARLDEIRRKIDEIDKND